jgi:hypothetical protein
MQSLYATANAGGDGGGQRGWEQQGRPPRQQQQQQQQGQRQPAPPRAVVPAPKFEGEFDMQAANEAFDKEQIEKELAEKVRVLACCCGSRRVGA